MPEQVRKTVEPLLQRLDQVMKGEYAAVLYGSLARGEYVPGRSDINLLLVLSQVDVDVLAALADALRSWEGSNPPPLLLSRSELARAIDVFPVEITDMRSAYQVLRGPDPLRALTVDPADLRRELEREFRGKLLRLRQGYTALHSENSGLGDLARHSFSSMLVLYRGLLALGGKSISRAAADLVTASAELVPFDPAPVREVLAHRDTTDWRCGRPCFEGYMRAMEHCVDYVDHFQTGGKA